MTCPANEVLAAWADDEVTLEMHRRLSQHVVDCGSCAAQAARLRVLANDLRRIELAAPAPGFSAAFEAKWKALPSAPAGHGHRRKAWLAAAGLVTACAALVGLLQMERGATQGFEERGGAASRRDRVGFEVYVHEPGRAPAHLERGRPVNSGAGYSFIVWNRSQKRQYLMLFAIDARSEVHWFFPAFLQAGTDPQSIVVPATPQLQALPEGITPDRPALGPIRFVGLFSAAPLLVSEVERRVQAGGLDALAHAHPDAALQVLRAELRKDP